MLYSCHSLAIAIGGILLIAGCHTAKVADKKLALQFQPGEPRAQTPPNLTRQKGSARGSGTSQQPGKGNGGSGNSSGQGEKSEGKTHGGSGKAEKNLRPGKKSESPHGKKSTQIADRRSDSSDNPARNRPNNAAKGQKSPSQTVENSEKRVMQFLHLKPVKERVARQAQLPPVTAPHPIPLTPVRKKSSGKTPRPLPNAGEKLIAQLRHSRAVQGIQPGKPKPLELALPEEKKEKFTPPPPVKGKVADNFMPYHKGEIITLDSNMIPARRGSRRIIVLYSGGSVYLSLKAGDVQMNGLYVRGKFRVREIVMERFSGKLLPVAVLDRIE